MFAFLYLAFMAYIVIDVLNTIEEKNNKRK